MDVEVSGNKISIITSCSVNYLPAEITQTIQAFVTINTNSEYIDNLINSTAFILVIDTSLSMRGNKISTVSKMVNYLLDNLGTNCFISILTFNDTVNEVSNKLLPVNAANSKYLSNNFNRIIPSGNTNISDALIVAANQLCEFKKSHSIPVEMLLFTDGFHNIGSDLSLAVKVISETMQEFAYPINNFAIGNNPEAKQLIELSNMSAGGHYWHMITDGHIATIFGEYVGSIKSRVCSDTSINFKAYKGTRISKIVGIDSLRCVKNVAKNITCYIGGLSSGSQKTLLLTLSIRNITPDEINTTKMDQKLVKIKFSTNNGKIISYLKVNRNNPFTMHIGDRMLKLLSEAVIRYKVIACLKAVSDFAETKQHYDAELNINKTINEISQYLLSAAHSFANDSIQELKMVNDKLHNAKPKNTIYALINSHEHQRAGRYITQTEQKSSDDAVDYNRRYSLFNDK